MCVKVGMKPGHSTVLLPAQRELIQPSETYYFQRTVKPKAKKYDFLANFYNNAQIVLLVLWHTLVA